MRHQTEHEREPRFISAIDFPEHQREKLVAILQEVNVIKMLLPGLDFCMLFWGYYSDRKGGKSSFTGIKKHDEEKEKKNRVPFLVRVER